MPILLFSYGVLGFYGWVYGEGLKKGVWAGVWGGFMVGCLGRVYYKYFIHLKYNWLENSVCFKKQFSYYIPI